MYLYIDSRSREYCVVGLYSSASLFATRRIRLSGSGPSGASILRGIDTVLRSHHVRRTTIRGIMIECGPGGFSMLRAGVVLGNTLGFSLGVPVVPRSTPPGELPNPPQPDEFRKSRASGKSVFPYYGAEPSITRSGKKVR